MKKQVRNIKFISPKDHEYRNYVRDIVDGNRAAKATTRPADYVPPQRAIMDQLSKPIEHTLRCWLNSDEERVVSFEFFNGTYWRRSYLELDAVHTEKNGTIKIYEFKNSANNTYCNKGVRQLLRAKDVLRLTGKKIHTILVQVSPAHRIAPESITHQFSPKAWELRPDLKEDSRTGQKFGFMRLAFADVFQYGIRQKKISPRYCLEDILRSGEQQYLHAKEEAFKKWSAKQLKTVSAFCKSLPKSLLTLQPACICRTIVHYMRKVHSQNIPASQSE